MLIRIFLPAGNRITIYLLLLSAFTSCHVQKNSSGSKSDRNAGSRQPYHNNINQAHSGNRTDGVSVLAGYQEKYEVLLGNPEILNNIALYRFMDDWLGTPYQYGGNSKDGIDCSRLSIQLLREVYQIHITGSSAEIHARTKSVGQNTLREGDLVFFKIGESAVNHMGVYLVNDKFIHATVQSGVIVSDLNEAYYRKYFYSAGRINR